MEVGKLTRIKYTKSNGDCSNRTIVPYRTDSSVLVAIDVTDIDDTSQAELAKLVSEYDEYRKEFMSSMFSLPVWAEHCGKEVTQGVTNWRSFHSSGIEVLDD